ncbi:hypothetical protein J6590_047149 [Homalodisca vitripennis]|nr:hypothetical protein J6590_047149 [Homalodisca vitripennis]
MLSVKQQMFEQSILARISSRRSGVLSFSSDNVSSEAAYVRAIHYRKTFIQEKQNSIGPALTLKLKSSVLDHSAIDTPDALGDCPARRLGTFNE